MPDLVSLLTAPQQDHRVIGYAVRAPTPLTPPSSTSPSSTQQARPTRPGQDRFAPQDLVEFSAEAQAKANEGGLIAKVAPVTAEGKEPTPPAEAGDHPTEQQTTGVQQQLTSEERQQVAELRQRDREVRSHEQAHLTAAGSLATGGPKFTYQTGPDGKQYAVGGEVPISLKSGDTPEETIRLARQAQRAALAPAQPSGQDRSVAAEASRIAARAQAELAAEKADAAPVGAADGEEKNGQQLTVVDATGQPSEAGAGLVPAASSAAPAAVPGLVIAAYREATQI